jgi:hypothetical protein
MAYRHAPAMHRFVTTTSAQSRRHCLPKLRLHRQQRGDRGTAAWASTSFVESAMHGITTCRANLANLPVH